MKQIHANSDEMNYPASKGVEELVARFGVDAVRRYCKEPQLIDVLSGLHEIPKQQIFLESGTIGIIHRIFDNMLNRHTEALLPELGYPYYHRLAREIGTKAVTYAFKADLSGYDLEDILRKVRQKPDILVLIDPESPLGFSITEDDLSSILADTASGTLVMLDQTYEGFRQKNIKDVTALISKHPNLLITRSFSKFYGLAGLRIAYGLCGADVKRMINFRERYLGFDSLAQFVAIKALESKSHYEANAAENRIQKTRFTEAVSELEGYTAHNRDTNSVVVEVPAVQCDILGQQAELSGILIRNLGDYHARLQNMYRVTMGQAEDTSRLIDLFSSVSWLFSLNVHNTGEKRVINTRDAGYSVARYEIDCQKSGLNMGYHRIIVPPGREVSSHSHRSQDELFEFHSEAVCILNGIEYTVRAGDVVVVKPGNMHSIRAMPNLFARFTALRFPYNLSDKYAPGGEQVVHERK